MIFESEKLKKIVGMVFSARIEKYLIQIFGRVGCVILEKLFEVFCKISRSHENAEKS